MSSHSATNRSVDRQSVRPLTPRERDVLPWVVEGHTSREIAQRLKISRRTVEVHRANLMRKLGVPNTASLVRYALQRGLLQDTKEPLRKCSPRRKTKKVTMSNQAKQASREELYQLVNFDIANEEFGVDILKVQEIIRVLEVTRVPNCPAFVEGVINLRGKIVPVVDLRLRFNLPQIEKDNNTRIIVVELEEKTVGFLVDRVKEVIRIETAIIEPPPELVTNVQTRYITGVAKLEDRLLILLDLDRVLTTVEQELLTLEEAVG